MLLILFFFSCFVAPLGFIVMYTSETSSYKLDLIPHLFKGDLLMFAVKFVIFLPSLNYEGYLCYFGREVSVDHKI